MNKAFYILLFILLSITPSFPAADTIICHVKSTTSNKVDHSSADITFATLNEAIKFLNSYKGKKSIHFNLEEGIHYLDSTIVISDIPIRLSFKSELNGRATISSGKEIKEFHINKKNIISFPVKNEVYKLLINDENIPLSTSLDFNNIQGLKKFSEFKEIEKYTYSAKFAFDEIEKMEIGAFIFIYCKWINYKLKIIDIDRTNRIVKMQGMYVNTKYVTSKDVYYSIFNSRALLSPGTFCCIDNTVYYKLKGNENRQSLQIRIPNLSTILKIDNCHNEISLNNIDFSNTSTYSILIQERQASIGQPQAISIYNSSNIIFSNCNFHHTMGYALSISKNSYECQINHCSFMEMEGGGIMIGDPSINDETHDILVNDNLIKSFGRINASCVGILATKAHHLKITHNTICDGFYTGINVGWTWGYKKSFSYNNYIANNHIHHLMQGLLSDGSGIYTLGIQEETIIENNYIHDIISRVYSAAGSSLLYFDEGSSNITARNNICYGSHTGFHEHYGKYNKVEDNFIGYTNLVTVRLSNPLKDSLLSITNNILITDCGTVYNKELIKKAKISNNKNSLLKTITNKSGLAKSNDNNNPVIDLGYSLSSNIKSLYKSHYIKKVFSCGITGEDQIKKSLLTNEHLNNHNKMVQKLFPIHSKYFDRTY